MDSFIKADIFFFISSVATAILTVLVSILLIYSIKAVKNLYALSESLKGGFKESKEFLEDLRERLESNIVFRLLFPAPRKRRRAVSKDDDSEGSN